MSCYTPVSRPSTPEMLEPSGERHFASFFHPRDRRREERLHICPHMRAVGRPSIHMFHGIYKLFLQQISSPNNTTNNNKPK